MCRRRPDEVAVDVYYCMIVMVVMLCLKIDDDVMCFVI